MSPPGEAAVRRTVDRHGAVRGAVTDRLTSSLLTLWDSASWYDHDLLTALAARSSTLVGLAQRQQSLATTAYLQALTRQHGITPEPTPPPAPEYPRLASPLDVYQRPAEQYRYRMSLPPAEAPRVTEPAARPAEPAADLSPVETLTRLAEQAAATRLRQLAETDMALTVRDTSASFVQANRRTISGYRRVLHPELAAKTGTACGLCVVAADRLYSVAELMALHDGCHCAVVPAYRGADPGKNLNNADLQRIYAAAGGTGRAELLPIRLAVKDNGEVGPVLTRHGDNFRDAADVAKDRGVRAAPYDRRASYEKQLHSLGNSLASLRRRAAAGEDLAQPISWQTARIAELTRLLAAAPAAAA